MPFHELINMDAIEQAINEELNEYPFLATLRLRKYGVFPDDIINLLTFTRACLGICERFDSDPFKIVNDLESYRTVCAKLETAISDIAKRGELETKHKEELQHSIDVRVLTNDLPFSAGVVHGLELALSSLGDLIENGFGDGEKGGK